MNLYELGTVEDVAKARARIVDDVAKSAYAVVRGLFDRDAVRGKLKTLYQRANTAAPLPSAGVSPDMIQKNVFKWSIGGHSTTQTGISRMMMTVYNPLSDADAFGLHDCFHRLIAVRDALADRPLLTDAALAPDRWNGTRVQIYPAGGGFIGAHADSRGVSNMPENTGPFIQLLMLLTERGIDYQRGGAFIERQGRRIDNEAETRSGDVIVYDGATIHGVGDVDPDIAFSATDLRGRAVALATIYDKR